jgi:predicted TIM-barrel fold metal-dependent hydrolase
MRTESLAAIDVHVHIEVDGHGHHSMDDELLDASAKYFRADHDRSPTLAQIADRYRSLNMAAVVFTVDASTNTGHATISSEEIATRAAEHSDVLIPFGSVDPLRGAGAVAQARSLVRDYGVRGFKFHPTLLFHSGQTGIGAGLPGGRGLKLRLSDPMLVDDVAADFPGLTVILAHPSVPWASSSISIATHKANVYIDLSGWSPKYFPADLVRAANSYLQDKVLFGTDYPLLTPERWLRDFETLDLKPAAKAKILKSNAVQVLGLG